MSGVLNAAAAEGGSAIASVETTVQFFGTHQLFLNFTSSEGLSNPRNTGLATGAITGGPAGFITRLGTPTQLLGLGEASFSITLFTSASSVGPAASARADFFGTLEFPTGIDVFNLPEGYTANAGNYLVNNRFVDPNAVGVPEPTTVLLLAAGLAGLMVQRRLRRT